MIRPMPLADVRALPLRVRPVAAETVTGFLGRLANANSLTPRDLRLHITDLAWRAAERCDVMLVVGTSGVVYPVAQLPLLAQQRGAIIIDVNPDCTPISEIADLFLQGASGTILPQVVRVLDRV